MLSLLPFNFQSTYLSHGAHNPHASQARTVCFPCQPESYFRGGFWVFAFPAAASTEKEVRRTQSLHQYGIRRSPLSVYYLLSKQRRSTLNNLFRRVTSYLATATHPIHQWGVKEGTEGWAFDGAEWGATEENQRIRVLSSHQKSWLSSKCFTETTCK